MFTEVNNENQQLCLHLVDIDDLSCANSCQLYEDEIDASELKKVARFIDGFLFFYKHADEMIVTLKSMEEVNLTENQEKLPRYCSHASSYNAKLFLEEEAKLFLKEERKLIACNK